jgi:(E)-4-hydroxy-3-methylbut-2-enyl-diphosphate synthase
MHSFVEIKRRQTRKIMVGNVPVGADSPIAVQSMTNTDTCNIAATVEQINKIASAGADIVRVSVPNIKAAEAFKEIKKSVHIPVVADIHFDHRIAIMVAEYGADCLRINPGNIGGDEKVAEVVACAKDHQIPIRIGVNGGSLEKDILEKYKEPVAEALVESAMRHIDILDKHSFDNFKVSVKASDVFVSYDAYKLLSKKIDQPLHLGITEAGGMRRGSVLSAIGLSWLLREGIGDTIRVSLAADPVEEVRVAFDILKALKLRSYGINFIACPTCSRTAYDVIGTLDALEKRLSDIKVPIDVAVMGCIVNGPGEAQGAHIGICGGAKESFYYENGERICKIPNEQLVDEVEARVRRYVDNLNKS